MACSRSRVALLFLVTLTGCLDTFGISGGDDTAAADATSPELTEPTGPGVSCDEDSLCEPGEEACSDCASCGNGEQDPGELCDDGNVDNDDACLAGCLPASCGDGFVRTDAMAEVCDDGPDNRDGYAEEKRCNLGCDGFAGHCGDGICQPGSEDGVLCGKDCEPVCGNTVVEAGEQCDDGEDSPSCDEDCTHAMCGDGHLNSLAEEECDDGNGDDADECAACAPATCGDGFVWAGVEACDDANDVNTDLCDDDCTTVEHRTVFLTSVKYKGNLGYLVDADGKCQSLAGSSGYRAWLSSSEGSPSTRFDKSFTGVYELVDGTIVAIGWAGLTSGTLLAPIDRTELGQQVNGIVWTNTEVDGSEGPTFQSCYDWTSDVMFDEGGAGLSNESGEAWTATYSDHFCWGVAHLYCFEDS